MKRLVAIKGSGLTIESCFSQQKKMDGGGGGLPTETLYTKLVFYLNGVVS